MVTLSGLGRINKDISRSRFPSFVQAEDFLISSFVSMIGKDARSGLGEMRPEISNASFGVSIIERT